MPWHVAGRDVKHKTSLSEADRMIRQMVRDILLRCILR